MGPLRKKSWWQKVLLSRITLIILIGIIFSLSFAVYDRYVVEREVAERRFEKELELEKESSRKAVLQDRVNYLNNEQGMESEIRSHFDVAKEGERVVILVGDKNLASAIEANNLPPNEAEKEKSWWQKLIPW